MALAEVYTNNTFLSSATNSDFLMGTDVDRYKTFTSSIASGGTPSLDSGILDMIMGKLNSFFSLFGMDNKSSIMDMIKGAISAALGIGSSIMDALGISSIINTICGKFDSGVYGRYGDLGMLGSLGLMGMLAALLCMGIKGALGIVSGALGLVGLAVGSLVGVVSATLDTLGFNPIKNIFGGISSNNYSSPTRQLTNSKLNISDILSDISSSNELTAAFRDTSTSDRLLSGYNGNSSDYEGYLDRLSSRWNVSTLGNSKNPSKAILDNAKSSALGGISNITSFSKKDFLKLL